MPIYAPLNTYTKMNIYKGIVVGELRVDFCEIMTYKYDVK